MPSSGDPELWGAAKALADEARAAVELAVACLYKAAEVYAGNGLSVPKELTAFKNAVEDCLPLWRKRT